MIRKGEIVAACCSRAMISRGGRACVRDTDAGYLKAIAEALDNVREGRYAAVIDHNRLELPHWKRLSREGTEASAQGFRFVVGRYDYGKHKFGLSHLRPCYQICIYDPGHFTPYYNAGLCKQFAAKGVGCTLITSPPTFEAVGPVPYEVSNLFFRFLQGPAGSLLRHRPRLRQILKAVSYPCGVWRTYRTLRRLEPGVFHIHFAVIPALDALLARALRRRGWHVVYTFQRPHPQGAWSRWEHGQLMSTCDAIVMHDAILAEQLRHMFPKYAERIASLTHGMDLPELPSEDQRASARAALGVSQHELLLLFFGMIKPYKGLEAVLDAMPAVLSRVPHVRLCIAGEPLMDMRGIMEKVAALPPQTVILRLGFVPQAEVGRYFAAADLVVACYKEVAASSVVLQAQTHARPTLATPVGALPTLLEQGRCGFLAGDNLAEAIVDALADANRLAEIGRRGRERVEKLHAWEKVAAETLQLYQGSSNGRSASIT